MIAIIPEPVEVIIKDGSFKIDSETSLFVEKKFSKLTNYVKDIFDKINGLSLEENDSEGANQIKIKNGKIEQNSTKEGYKLRIKKDSIEIIAEENKGVFYALQTLKQLLPIGSVKGDLELSCVEIIDYPRFQWRGFMLDEARHFMGKEIVKKILDIMALHKLNKFHWHLVDDQGWRIEIKKYPKLIEIGSKRKIVTRRGEISNLKNPDEIGGYYTQEEIKEIIAYASERFIEIIPEIEMPGHCTSALAAYPELSCKGGPFEVPTKWGIFFDVYCPGKEKVYKFLEEILLEVIALFPSEIIHIGGDEVPKKRWKKCPDCQKKMNELGIEKESELQDYLTNYFEKFLESHGKRLMGWNQILNPGLTEEAICQYWLGNKTRVIEHMQRGGEVVATNYLQTYLDHPYKIISLKKAYKFEPKFPKLDATTKQKIIGIEAPLWTERVPNLKRLEWQIFPRLTAYAETAWTPKKKKNYEKFIIRLHKFNKRLKLKGVNIAFDKIN